MEKTIANGLVGTTAFGGCYKSIKNFYDDDDKDSKKTADMVADCLTSASTAVALIPIPPTAQLIAGGMLVVGSIVKIFSADPGITNEDIKLEMHKNHQEVMQGISGLSEKATEYHEAQMGILKAQMDILINLGYSDP